MKRKDSAVDMMEKEVSFFLGASVIWDSFTVVAIRQHRDIASSTTIDCHNKIPLFTYRF